MEKLNNVSFSNLIAAQQITFGWYDLELAFQFQNFCAVREINNKFRISMSSNLQQNSDKKFELYRIVFTTPVVLSRH